MRGCPAAGILCRVVRSLFRSALVLLATASILAVAPRAAVADPLNPDRNRDGEVVIACLGDSNTDSTWQHEAPGGFSEERGWCERLEDLFEGRVRTVNLGMGGATILDHPELLHGGDMERIAADARRQFRIALESARPDILILAFGTNDVLDDYGFAPDEIVHAYRRFWQMARAEGLLLLAATVPPVQPAEAVFQAPRFRGGGDGRSRADLEEVNRMLRARFPERLLVDFANGFSLEEFLDRVHLNEAGQERRARLAHQAVRRALRELPPVGAARQLRWQGGSWTTLSPREAVASPFAEEFLED